MATTTAVDQADIGKVASVVEAAPSRATPKSITTTTTIIITSIISISIIIRVAMAIAVALWAEAVVVAIVVAERTDTRIDLSEEAEINV